MMKDATSLIGTQRWIQQALIHPELTDAREVAALVAATGELSPRQRLGLYQRGYYLRLLKCMEQQFPALSHAMGTELFYDFTRDYLEKSPPESHTLYDLGRRFPDYLQDTRPDRYEMEADQADWIDFMVDLARYERTVFVMFDVPGHEGKAFATVRDADADLVLQPCFEVAEYRFPVAWYYHEVRARRPVLPPSPVQSMVAMVRTNYMTRTLPLSMPHFLFLKTMKSGLSISAALDWVAIELGQSPETVAASWRDGVREHWIEAGFFICKLANEEAKDA